MNIKQVGFLAVTVLLTACQNFGSYFSDTDNDYLPPKPVPVSSNLSINLPPTENQTSKRNSVIKKVSAEKNTVETEAPTVTRAPSSASNGVPGVAPTVGQ